MRLLDSILSKSRDKKEQDALRALANKLVQGGFKRESVIASAPLPALAAALLDFEGVFSSFSLPEHPTAAETVQAERLLKQLLALQEGPEPEVPSLSFSNRWQQAFLPFPRGRISGCR